MESEYVFIYAAVPKKDFHKVAFPEGTFAKGLDIKSQELTDKEMCMRFGHIVYKALYRLGNRLNPSPIVKDVEL